MLLSEAKLLCVGTQLHRLVTRFTVALIWNGIFDGLQTMNVRNISVKCPFIPKGCRFLTKMIIISYVLEWF